MALPEYADVHPNWEIVESLDTVQSEAILDLLATATLVDGDLTDAEFETLAEELVELPFVGADKTTLLADEIDRTQSRVESFEKQPERFDEFIEQTCSKVDSEDIQLAALRLLAIDITVDEPTERQQELYYAAGRAWELDFDTLEDLLRSAWDSHERLRDEASGRDHDLPPVKGSNWARERSLQPYPNPFEQRIG
jgi:hypothetical protein